MFVRIVWNAPAQPTGRPSLRKVPMASRRAGDDLGVMPRDFAKMTLGLFDKQD